MLLPGALISSSIRLAGIVRDIPELGVDKENVQKGIWSAYNSRVYDMDVDFQDNGRKKVLAIGNSYARDWVNILLEAGYENDMDITYIYHLSDSKAYIERSKQADYIFTSFDERLNELVMYIKSDLIKIISNKLQKYLTIFMICTLKREQCGESIILI